MEYAQIKTELESAGCQISDIAEAIKKSTTAINKVAKRESISKPIALNICKLLGKSPQEVFPDVPQYHPDYSVKKLKKNRVDLIRQRLIA